VPAGGDEILAKIESAGAQARDQIRQAQLAFAERRLDLAEDLVRQDDVIDLLNRDVFYAAAEIVGDTEAREWAAHVVLIARYLERVGDHTVDIGEQIAFVISGEFREFTDASRPGGVPDPA
jgi:phosphate transport system protein